MRARCSALTSILTDIPILFLFSCMYYCVNTDLVSTTLFNKKSALCNNLFGHDNIFQRNGLLPFSCLSPFTMSIELGCDLLQNGVLPLSFLVECGIQFKRLLRSLAGMCPKGEEYSEENAVFFMVLSHVLLFPLMVMRLNWYYIVGAFIGQILATRNIKASLMFMVKLCIIEVPVFFTAPLVSVC